jgi:hypothetical protein
MAQVVVNSKKKVVDVYIGLLGFVTDSHVLQKNSLHRQAQCGSFFSFQNGSQNVILLDIPCSIG